MSSLTKLGMDVEYNEDLVRYALTRAFIDNKDLRDLFHDDDWVDDVVASFARAKADPRTWSMREDLQRVAMRKPKLELVASHLDLSPNAKANADALTRLESLAERIEALNDPRHLHGQ